MFSRSGKHRKQNHRRNMKEPPAHKNIQSTTLATLCFHSKSPWVEGSRMKCLEFFCGWFGSGRLSNQKHCLSLVCNFRLVLGRWKTDLFLEDSEELISNSDSDFSSGGWQGSTLANHHSGCVSAAFVGGFCSWFFGGQRPETLNIIEYSTYIFACICIIHKKIKSYHKLLRHKTPNQKRHR